MRSRAMLSAAALAHRSEAIMSTISPRRIADSITPASVVLFHATRGCRECDHVRPMFLALSERDAGRDYHILYLDSDVEALSFARRRGVKTIPCALVDDRILICSRRAWPAFLEALRVPSELEYDI